MTIKYLKNIKPNSKVSRNNNVKWSQISESISEFMPQNLLIALALMG